MLVIRAVAMVRLDDLVHEGGKVVVRLVGATVDTDTGVGPLAAGVDGLLESESKLVLLVLELLPNLGGQALGQEGLGASGEVGEVCDLIWAVEVRADEGSSGSGFSNLQRFR